METIRQLDIQGHQRLPLTNTFFQHAEKTDRLAVLFPGRGYSCAMPVLYYPSRWLFTHGANVLTIEYGFTQKQQNTAKLKEEDLLRWLAADARAALLAALSTGNYNDVILVGKSLGTLALSQLCSDLPPDITKTSFVWLTPLFKNPSLRAAFLQSCPRSLMVQGEQDPHYEAGFFEEIRLACSAQALIIPSVDHSLEQAGDFSAALAAIRSLLDSLEEFTGW